MASVRALRGRRSLGMVVAAPVAALALAGCANFQSAPTASQDNVIGAADIHTAICLSGFGSFKGALNPAGAAARRGAARANDMSGSGTPVPGCDTSQAIPNNGQVLVGYLLPDGATAPQTLSSPDLPGVTFSQDPDYAQWLGSTTAADAPGPLPGSHWVGYISTVTSVASVTAVHIDAAFGLPANADGSPYAGPFSAETVVGDRSVWTPQSLPGSGGIDAYAARAHAQDSGATNPAGDNRDRPLDCEGPVDASPYDGYDTDCNEDVRPVSLQTRDLGILAPQPVTVQAGQTATLPFTLAYAGAADPTATFALSGVSDGSGAPTTADAIYTPADAGDTTENVTDAVPASTAPGTYHVTLTAVGSDAACADKSQCSRTAIATVIVTAPAAPGSGANTGAGATPTPPTTATPVTPSPRSTKVKPLRFSARLVSVGRPHQSGLFARGWRLRMHCNQACAVSAQVFVYHGGYYHGRGLRAPQNPIAHIVVGERLYNLARAGTDTRYIRLSPAAVRALTLAHMHSFRINLHLWATDAHGGQRTHRVRRQVWIAN